MNNVESRGKTTQIKQHISWISWSVTFLRVPANKSPRIHITETDNPLQRSLPHEIRQDRSHSLDQMPNTTLESSTLQSHVKTSIRNGGHSAVFVVIPTSFPGSLFLPPPGAIRWETLGTKLSSCLLSLRLCGLANWSWKLVLHACACVWKLRWGCPYDIEKIFGFRARDECRRT